MTCHSKSNTKTKRDCHQLHAQSRVVKDEQKVNFDQNANTEEQAKKVQGGTRANGGSSGSNKIRTARH